MRSRGVVAETAMSAANEPVLLEALEAGVLRLTLNRPAARNALPVGLMDALKAAFGPAAADSACRVVVIAAAAVDMGLVWRAQMVELTRAVGRKPAMEMLLTGDFIDAATARALGLVNRVVPSAGLGAATLDLARQIAAKSALIVAIGKEAFYAQAELGLGEAYRYAAEVMTRNMLARDAAEGIDAFLEKRPPVWQDA